VSIRKKLYTRDFSNDVQDICGYFEELSGSTIKEKKLG
jgi:hypothetical protein